MRTIPASVPGHEFFASEEDEQAILVAIPEGFELASAKVYKDGFIHDKGTVTFNPYHDGGSIVRLAIKRTVMAE